MSRHLAIAAFGRSAHQLWMAFDLDGMRFSTSYWYEGVDLDELERRYGRALLERIYFHIAAFEANKLTSLAPNTFDLGPFARLQTAAFERLWREIWRGVWAQWRYENDRPDYLGPGFATTPRAPGGEPAEIEPGDVEVLAFCGGGKDSLVAAKLLERGGVPFSSLAYSASIYGRAAPQHALIDGLLDHCAPVHRHRQWIYDDFMDSPVLRLRDDARTLTAAETPASIFGALPLALAGGYTTLALAHEASANAANLTWDATGEPVNHQWGKSLAAERLLNDYVRAELLANVGYCSLLQPVYDPVIFALLARDLDAVAATHSCNVAKPWCKRCAKCAYVWLGYAAYLPRERVDAMFGGANLLDDPANLPHYRAMLGLADRTPFECIGHVDETRLAFELCRRKGLRGRAMELFEAEVPPLDLARIADRFLAVDRDVPTMSPRLRDAVLPQLEAGAEAARSLIA